MYVLSRNSASKDNPEYREAVEKWQNFLVGRGYEDLSADGDFGPKSEAASKEFQQEHGLKPDGVVGNRTYGIAMQFGFEAFDEDDDNDSSPETSPNWPQPPAGLHLPEPDEVVSFFGKIQWEPSPRPGNQEAIRITNGWDNKYIVKVAVPQLSCVSDAPHTTEVYFHKNVVGPVASLFAAWQDADLMDRVLTWGGSYVPRCIRGSRTRLSNHAYGAAFDINVPWNPLGTRPPICGGKGCVRELVQIANQHGFYWGGHYKNRPDGMHFEYVNI